MTSLNGSAHSMVDLENGEISREIFVNEEIYRQEQERLFSRAWLYVGHESQVCEPGDFFVSCMGEESVILTRDRAGVIHVFLNTCRHRGMKVCRSDEGNTRTFICPYHGWSYGTNGELVGVQDFDNAYQPPFDKADWGLIEVAQIANYRGTIWATWDGAAPPFEDYLGDAKFALDIALGPWDAGSGKTELLGSVQKWLIPSNWKFVAENFAGDALHVVSHRSVDMVGIGPNDQEGRRDDPGAYAMVADPRGHGFTYGKQSIEAKRADYADSKVTAEYYRACLDKRIARMGDNASLNMIVGTIFPSMSLHGQQPRTIIVAHPRGATLTELWRCYFVDADAPEEAKRFLRSYSLRYSGPAGMTEQDDMENWNYASAASKGTIARLHPYHYKAGLGAGGPNDQIPGVYTDAPFTTEQNPRYLYRRWAQFMDSTGWDELRAAGLADG